LRVVTPEEMVLIDKEAIAGEKIPGLVLMERAGQAVARAARDMLGRAGGNRAAIFCGKGNNGGDGFVVARLLADSEIDADVFLLADPLELSGDASANFERLGGLPVRVTWVASPLDLEEGFGDGAGYGLMVDAIFGTGFSGRAEGIFERAIQAINGAGCPVLSVDIPSGVNGLTGAADGPAVAADVTVTFAAPKVGLVQFPGAGLAGAVETADIGIPERLLESVPESRISVMTESEAAALLPERRPDAHKGQCGSVLVVGGSPGLTGAAAMCAQAALRAGAGLVTLGVPEGVHDILEVKLTEVMTRALPQTAGRTLSREAAEYILRICRDFEVLALGPGLSTNGETREAVRELVRSVPVPLVLDADGLNAMSGHVDILMERRAPLVVTPHPGEMARLLESDTASVQADRVGAALDAARSWGAVVVLKGANTVIADADGTVRINTTGNPGMASAGMGDVLTGCVAALIARGLGGFDAASAGVYYHGHAADLAAAMDGMVGMTAGDVIRHLPLAMRRRDEI
jgi:ADP-dependent NAD(P)H-hydrate dehydratase / NAD(P)H-hydrate epimerase